MLLSFNSRHIFWLVLCFAAFFATLKIIFTRVKSFYCGRFKMDCVAISSRFAAIVAPSNQHWRRQACKRTFIECLPIQLWISKLWKASSKEANNFIFIWTSDGKIAVAAIREWIWFSFASKWIGEDECKQRKSEREWKSFSLFFILRRYNNHLNMKISSLMTKRFRTLFLY